MHYPFFIYLSVFIYNCFFMKNLKSFLPHLAAIFGFVIMAIIYFYPVLSGEQIYQSDIEQYTGMAKEQNDFRAEFDAEPYWTNSAFGGMPTYQLGAKYPHNYVKKLDSVLRFLPRPADYLFLYFIGFYILLSVLKIDPLKAFFGAIAFGLSTYFIIILGVGHNAKAHAIAYMPIVLAGVLLVLQRKYLVGLLVLTIGSALEIQANHFQMTYYLLILLVVVGIFYSIQFIKEKDYRGLAKAIGVFVVAAIFAIGANATSLLATSEYAAFSTRSKSELTFNEDGSKKTSSNAMSNDYITAYSYGKVESLNLIAPRIFGGSNAEKLPANGAMYDYLLQQNVPEAEASTFIEEMPAYWGDQPGVSAPAYIGIVVFFFFILALFIEKRKTLKYALLVGAILALLLSWGKNFSFLTDLFIAYFPMYNKFRAVSSIQVIVELCVPILAVLGFSQFYKLEDKKVKLQFLYKTGAIVGGVLVLLFLAQGMFSFTSLNDDRIVKAYGPEFLKALKSDRQSMYVSDVLRSLGFALVVFGCLYLYVKEKLKSFTSVILIGIFMIADLFFVAKNYVNKSDFVEASRVETPFQPNEADLEILKDTTHYRVFDATGALNSARASYFHQSVGGYHGAKPQRFEQLFYYQMAKNNLAVYNMLNVKYVIQQDDNGAYIPLTNAGANGNAWFVEKTTSVASDDLEMKALDNLDTKDEAVFQNDNKTKLSASEFVRDSLANISLLSYQPNRLKYKSSNSNDGFAVFSEMYYEDGWKAKIDGKEAPIVRVNFALRGLNIPKGNHTIEFSFEPQVVKTGSTIALISSILILLLIALVVYFEAKRVKS